MKKIYAGLGSSIDLGRQGESLARSVVFVEPAEWRAAYGDGIVQLIAQRYGESTVYPVALDTDGDAAVWHVTAADTALEGYGRCELRYLVDEVVVKSKSYLTYVAESMTGDEIDPPEPQQGWVDRVLLAGGDAQAAAEAAEAAAKRAEAVDVAGLDTTLTEEGKAADAKAVGEALKNAGAVKTVNGVEPDESGNVEVEVGGDPVQPDWSVNDASDPAFVKNRTHYDSRHIETLEINWDGNTEGKVVAGGIIYKVSDVVVRVERITDATFRGVPPSGDLLELTGSQVVEMGGPQSEAAHFIAAGMVYIAHESDSMFPEPGIYFARFSDTEGAEYLSLSYEVGEVKQLEAKYLPDALQVGEFPAGGDTFHYTGPGCLEGRYNATISPDAPSLYLISDGVPTAEQIEAGVLFGPPGDLGVPPIIPEQVADGVFGLVLGMIGLVGCIVTKNNIQFDVFNFAHAGVYWVAGGENIADITIPGFKGFPSVKKFDPKYLPYYHAVDKVDLVNGTITTENQVAEPDIPFYLSVWGQEVTLDRPPEKLTVVFDGVEYAELQGRRRFVDMVGSFIYFGNEAVVDPNLVGGELDTGEPFLIEFIQLSFTAWGLTLYTNTPTGQTHSLVVSTIATHDLDIGGNARFGGTVEAQAVILTNPNGVRYSITVNHHGELTAAEVTA